jgi:thioredoxin 1
MLPTEPTREEIDKLEGPTLLEFGSPYCGYCRAAQPLISAALAEHPGVRHIKVVDAKGRRLGRSFGVKLWPTLVFLGNGKERARVVRPEDADEIREGLATISNLESGAASNRDSSSGERQ